MEPNLSQALHLLNGDTGNSKIAQGAFVPTRLKEKKTPAQIIEELYISCFSRKPTEKETKDLTGIVAASDDPTEVLEDVLWSLLNAREFLFNH